MELPHNAPDDFDPRLDARTTAKLAQKKQRAQEESNKSRARAKGQKAMAGSASVALMTGGRKLDRKALRATVKAQLQHTTESTASAGVFVDAKEKKRNRVKIDHNKHVTERAPGTDQERQGRVLDRVLAKQAAPNLVLEKAVARHRAKERLEKAHNPSKQIGRAAKGKGGGGSSSGGGGGGKKR